MKESDIRGGLNHAMLWRNWRPLHWNDARAIPCRKCHTINLAKPDQIGRCDVIGIHHQFPAVFIEVKDCKSQAFAFSEIEPEQRKYLSDWEGEGYICIGRIVPMGTRETIHSIYVVPWKEWLQAEKDIESLLGDKSMPYSYELYKNGSSRGPDLVHRFPQYALEHRDGDWHFKDSHPLAVQNEVTIPFHKRGKDEYRKMSQVQPALSSAG